MDNNLDRIFKEKVSSMDNKPMDWNKEGAWDFIQRRKKKYTLKNLLKYAAMLALVFGSALVILQTLSKKEHEEQAILTREEKYEKLEIIEQRLSKENGTSYICYTCFNPYLKTGTKPAENGFRVEIYY
jgi:hypothetical protein